MKTLTLEELRKLEEGKLRQEIESALKALQEIKFEVKSAGSKSVHEIKLYRRYIAKIKTILKEQQHAN